MSLPSFITEPNPEIYMSDNFVVIDYETTNTDKGDPRRRENSLVYAAWKCGPDHVQYTGQVRGKRGDEFSQDALVEAILSADFIVAQNTKFEQGWSKRIGVPLESKLWYCTILGAYSIDGNRRRPRDLDSLCKRYGIQTKADLVSILIKGGVPPEDIPAPWLASYGKQDVRITEELFLAQRADLAERGLLGVAYTKNLFTPVLTDIEFNGMFLDKERVLTLHESTSTELAEVENELKKTYGEINFGSPIQVAELVYDTLGFSESKDRQGRVIRNKPSKRFPQGQPKTDAATLENITASTQKQETFVQLFKRRAKLSKKLSTYLTRFKDSVDNNGCLLQGRFNQAITQTHRLSSSDPNFQNFDRTLKYLFTARNKGWLVGERDEAQLEFRVATFLGDDPQGREDIKNDFDVHSFTSGVIYGGELTKDKRTAAKAHTFKPLFGGVSGTDKEREYYKAFREKYSGVTSTQDEWVDKALSDGTFLNLTGLKFYHKCKITRSGYVEGNTNVRNYPIQYLATGEIVPIGCVYTWHYMKDLNMQSFLVNTVHDSIISEEHPEETQELTRIAEQAFGPDVIQYMEKVYGFTFDVPLELETETFTHWSSN